MSCLFFTQTDILRQFTAEELQPSTQPVQEPKQEEDSTQTKSKPNEPNKTHTLLFGAGVIASLIGFMWYSQPALDDSDE